MRPGQWRVSRGGMVFLVLIGLALAAVTLAHGVIRSVGIAILIAGLVIGMGAALSGGAGSAVRGFGPKDR